MVHYAIGITEEEYNYLLSLGIRDVIELGAGNFVCHHSAMFVVTNIINKYRKEKEQKNFLSDYDYTQSYELTCRKRY